MRRMKLLLTGALVFALLLAGCGGDPAPSETTAPPVETTAPPETTLPPETTAPPETTQPAVQNPPTKEIDPDNALMINAGFELIQGNPYLNAHDSMDVPIRCRFQYVGDEETITFPGLSIGLTLPQEWRDQLTVTTGRYYDPEETYAEARTIYIHVNRVLEAQLEYHLQEYPDETPVMPYYDYALFIGVTDWSVFEERKGEIDPYHPEYGIYLGEDEHYVYTAYLPGDERYPQARMNAQYFLIEKIGEDAYNELVGDLVLTYDMVREMITIQEPGE